MVNSVYSYLQHKPTNVLGVKEVLAFACSSSIPKALHHISTVGMLGGTLDEVFEVPLSSRHENTGGYAQSKWVGEQLVNKFHQTTSSNVCIYRPSTIFGSTATGASNPKDTASGMIRGLIIEGMYCDSLCNPQDGKSMLPGELNLVPVDWAASSIISLSHTNAKGKAFHISNGTLTNMETIIQWIEKCGYDMKKVHDFVFQKAVEEIRHQTHPFYIFKSVISNSGYAASIDRPNVTRTSAALSYCGGSPVQPLSFNNFNSVIEFFEYSHLLEIDSVDT